MNASSAAPLSNLQAFAPKLVTVLRDGYSSRVLRADGFAALIGASAVVPVILALTITAGVSPDRGMIGAAVAICIASLFGGSSFQTCAPTVLLTVAVGPVLAASGQSGLAVATACAGALLMIAAIAHWHTWVRYVPSSLLTGAEAGVAIVLAWHQMGHALGFSAPSQFGSPHDIARTLLGDAPEIHLWPLGLLIGSFLLLIALRRMVPHWPAALLAVAGASLATWLMHLPVETLGDRFARNVDGVTLRWPELARGDLNGVIPTAFTLAFLIGVQSLRGARMADTHSGRWHRAPGELLAEGIANVAVATIGGLPVGGDPARAVENVKAGALSPVAGILTGLLVFAATVLVRPCAAYVPVESLSAVLLVIAWDLGRWSRLRLQIGASRMDHTLAAMVALLVVFVGIGTAVAAGVTLAALLVAHRRWSDRAEVRTDIDETALDTLSKSQAPSNGSPASSPPGITVFAVRGPLVFGSAHELGRLFPCIERQSRALILDVQRVTCVDATGTEALEDLLHRCQHQGTILVLAHLAPAVRAHLSECGLLSGNRFVIARHIAHALKIVDALTGDSLVGERG